MRTDLRVDRLIVASFALIAEGAQQRARRVEQEHAVVLEAIERGDPDCAEAGMRLNLLSAGSRALYMPR